jgi:hypothetical protein
MEPTFLCPAILVLICIAAIHGGIQIIRRKEYSLMKEWGFIRPESPKYTGNSALVLGYVQLVSALLILSGIVATYVVGDSPITWIFFGGGLLSIVIGVVVGALLRYSATPTK